MSDIMTEEGLKAPKAAEFPTEAPPEDNDFEEGGMRTFTLGEMMVYVLVAAAAGAVAIYWIASKPVEAYSVNHVPTAWSSLAVQCNQSDGNWLIEHRECENVAPEWCDDRGGHFFSCESACRHEQSEDGVPIACTMQCVPVCRLKVAVSTLGPGPMNTSYTIDGKEVVLVRGRFEQPNLSDASASVRIWVFEALTSGDLDDDGDDDAVVILVKEGDHDSTLYYVAVAIQQGGEFSGINAVLIGDRIAPQNNSIDKGIAVVNYADRYPWESFDARPSVGKSKRLHWNGTKLVGIISAQLDIQAAKEIVVEKWGDCSDSQCSDFKVRVLDGRDGVWYAEATYRGLKDDSVQAIRRVAFVHFIENEWKMGAEQTTQYLCQPGRGQQKFAEDICL